MTSLPKGTVVLTGDALLRAAKAVGTTHHLLLHAGDWLSHLNFFTDAQLHDILRFIRPAIEYISTLPIDDAAEGDLQYILAVASYRWISITGIETVWDSLTAEERTVYAGRPVTYITCDIMALRRLADSQEKIHDAIEDQLKPNSTGRETGSASST